MTRKSPEAWTWPSSPSRALLLAVESQPWPPPHRGASAGQLCRALLQMAHSPSAALCWDCSLAQASQGWGLCGVGDWGREASHAPGTRGTGSGHGSRSPTSSPALPVKTAKLKSSQPTRTFSETSSPFCAQPWGGSRAGGDRRLAPALHTEVPPKSPSLRGSVLPLQHTQDAARRCPARRPVGQPRCSRHRRAQGPGPGG